MLIITGLDIRAYRGGEKYAAALGRELARRGVEVRLLSKVDPRIGYRLGTPELAEVVKLPVEFYHPSLLPLLPPIVWDPLALVRSLRWADVVYAIESTPSLVALLWGISRWLGRRFVIGLHSPTLVAELDASWGGSGRPTWPARQLRWVLQHADAVHALTDLQTETLGRIGVRSNVAVIPVFSSIARVADPPLRRDRFEVLFVGPLEQQQKGIDLLVEICRRVLAARDSVHVTVVGSGPADLLVRKLVEEFPQRVEMLGFVPEERLPTLYAGAHASLLTSRAEAFPAVPLEALAQGVPVVGFAIPGLTQLFSVYPEGGVPAFSVDEFAQRVLALEELWRTRPELYLRLREQCRGRADARFSARATVPLLASLLGVPGTQPSGVGQATDPPQPDGG